MIRNKNGSLNQDLVRINKWVRTKIESIISMKAAMFSIDTQTYRLRCLVCISGWSKYYGLRCSWFARHENIVWCPLDNYVHLLKCTAYSSGLKSLSMTIGYSIVLFHWSLIVCSVSLFYWYLSCIKHFLSLNLDKSVRYHRHFVFIWKAYRCHYV